MTSIRDSKDNKQQPIESFHQYTYHNELEAAAGSLIADDYFTVYNDVKKYVPHKLEKKSVDSKNLDRDAHNPVMALMRGLTQLVFSRPTHYAMSKQDKEARLKDFKKIMVHIIEHHAYWFEEHPAIKTMIINFFNLDIGHSELNLNKIKEVITQFDINIELPFLVNMSQSNELFKLCELKEKSSDEKEDEDIICGVNLKLCLPHDDEPRKELKALLRAYLNGVFIAEEKETKISEIIKTRQANFRDFWQDGIRPWLFHLSYILARIARDPAVKQSRVASMKILRILNLYISAGAPGNALAAFLGINKVTFKNQYQHVFANDLLKPGQLQPDYHTKEKSLTNLYLADVDVKNDINKKIEKMTQFSQILSDEAYQTLLKIIQGYLTGSYITQDSIKEFLQKEEINHTRICKEIPDKKTEHELFYQQICKLSKDDLQNEKTVRQAIIQSRQYHFKTYCENNHVMVYMVRILSVIANFITSKTFSMNMILQLLDFASACGKVGEPLFNALKNYNPAIKNAKLNFVRKNTQTPSSLSEIKKEVKEVLQVTQTTAAVVPTNTEIKIPNGLTVSQSLSNTIHFPSAEIKPAPMPMLQEIKTSSLTSTASILSTTTHNSQSAMTQEVKETVRINTESKPNSLLSEHQPNVISFLHEMKNEDFDAVYEDSETESVTEDVASNQMKRVLRECSFLKSENESDQAYQNSTDQRIQQVIDLDAHFQTLFSQGGFNSKL